MTRRVMRLRGSSSSSSPNPDTDHHTLLTPGVLAVRRLFEATFFHGESNAYIAAALGISSGTVASIRAGRPITARTARCVVEFARRQRTRA